MKKTLATVLSLPSIAFAGPTEMAPQQIHVSPTLHDEPDWFIGASGGFLLDAEDEFYSLQIGKRIDNLGDWKQSLFLDIGYSELKNDGDELNLEESFNLTSDDSFTGDADIEADFIPITLNYMLERELTTNLNFYMGVGAGVAIIDADGNFDDPANSIDDSGNDSKSTFFAQAFLGLSYDFNPNLSLYGGARYMYIDDYSLTTNSGSKIEVDDNDDVLVEMGIRVRF
ncbi:TonB-dependent receptor [Verrucomicrobiaceae bacterium R5-34]|nr:TonB-dependent receptor [Verrucomicrobiaceae bacterium R5-34]